MSVIITWVVYSSYDRRKIIQNFEVIEAVIILALQAQLYSNVSISTWYDNREKPISFVCVINNHATIIACSTLTGFSPNLKVAVQIKGYVAPNSTYTTKETWFNIKKTYMHECCYLLMLTLFLLLCLSKQWHGIRRALYLRDKIIHLSYDQ